MEILLAFLFFIGSGAVLSLLVRKLRSRWSWQLVSFVAAAVAPLVLLLLVAGIYFDAATTPAEQCWPDACGMAMMAAMITGMVTLAGFAVSLGTTLALQYWLSRR